MEKEQYVRYIYSIRRHWKALFFIVLLLVVFYTVSQYGLLHIEVQNTSPGDVSYELYSDGSTKASIAKGGSSITKIVHKGSYQVLAENGDKSSVALIQTGGFLMRETMSINLIDQRQRSFIGNSPKGCMFEMAETLYSYTCGGGLSSLQAHIPATSTTPTHTTQFTNDNATLEGVTQTAKSTLALVAPADPRTQHTLFDIGSNLNFTNGKVLEDLLPDSKYAMTGYRDGFLIYDTPDITKLLYYSTATAKPLVIPLPALKDPSLIATTLDVRGSQILVYYTDGSEGAGDKDGNSKANPPRSEVIVYDSARSIRASFNKRLGSPLLCGDKIVCSVEDYGMSIYDVSAGKAKKLYSVPFVTSIQHSDQNLGITQNGRFINFDINKRTGQTEYTFDRASYCGFQQITNSYILCVLSAHGQKTALVIDRQASDSDAIDKKIFKLENNHNIQNVSIEGRNIFISGNYGGTTYVEDQGYINDPITVKAVTSAINELIDINRINRNKYNIVIY